MGPKPRPVEERFWAKVEKGDGCWNWTGATKENGYGVIGVPPRRLVYTHRLSYSLAFGEIPDGLNVCHRCDNPACVNPEHLFVGSQYDNIQDMLAKGRQRRYERHGARNPRAVLTKVQTMEVREMRKAGATLSSIADRFGIGTSQVHRIATHKSWSKVLP